MVLLLKSENLKTKKKKRRKTRNYFCALKAGLRGDFAMSYKITYAMIDVTPLTFPSVSWDA